MWTSSRTIGRITMRIFIRVIRNRINIFGTNHSNYFTSQNFLTNINEKMWGKMRIRGGKRRIRDTNSITIGSTKANKGNCTREASKNFSTLRCTNINTRMIGSFTSKRRFPITKRRGNLFIIGSRPNKTVKEK